MTVTIEKHPQDNTYRLVKETKFLSVPRVNRTKYFDNPNGLRLELDRLFEKGSIDEEALLDLNQEIQNLDFSFEDEEFVHPFDILGLFSAAGTNAPICYGFPEVGDMRHDIEFRYCTNATCAMFKPKGQFVQRQGDTVDCLPQLKSATQAKDELADMLAGVIPGWEIDQDDFDRLYAAIEQSPLRG